MVISSGSPKRSSNKALRYHVHNHGPLTLIIVMTMSSMGDEQGHGEIIIYAKQLMEEEPIFKVLISREKSSPFQELIGKAVIEGTDPQSNKT